MPNLKFQIGPYYLFNFFYFKNLTIFLISKNREVEKIQINLFTVRHPQDLYPQFTLKPKAFQITYEFKLHLFLFRKLHLHI